MKERTQEEMFQAIREWEMEAGEDFCDYFEGNVNEANFVFWCLGKGYLTEQKVKLWEKQMNSASLSDLVISDEEFAVIQTTEFTDEEYVKAYKILAEFLCSSTTYQERVDLFLRNMP